MSGTLRPEALAKPAERATIFSLDPQNGLGKACRNRSNRCWPRLYQPDAHVLMLRDGSAHGH
jgi:hypothetical protein